MELIDNLRIESKDLQNLGNLLYQDTNNDWLNYLSIPIVIAELQSSKIVYTNHSFVNMFPSQKYQNNHINILIDYLGLSLFKEIFSKLKIKNHLVLDNVKLTNIQDDEKQFNLVIELFSKDDKQLFMMIFHEVESPKLVTFSPEISKLSTLLNNLPCVVYYCRNDQEKTIEFISDESLSLTGFSPSELIDNKYCSFKDLIHPLDRDFLEQKVQKALKNHDSYNLEYRIITRFNEEKWVYEKGKGIYNSSGEAIFLEGFMIDITDKKKREKQQKLLLTLTQQIAKSSNFKNALLTTLRKVCEFTDWDFGEAWIPNEKNQFLQYAGAWFSPEKNKRKLDDLSLEEYKKESYNFSFPKSIGLAGKVWELKKAYWLKNVSTESLFVRNKLALQCGLKAGFGVPIIAENEVVAILVFFIRKTLEKDQEMINIIKSITYQLGTNFNQKKIQVELAESKKQLATLIDSTSGIFFRLSYSPDWLPNYISNGCEILTGYTKDELIENDSLHLATITHPLDLERVIDIITETLKTQNNYVVEYRIFTKNNQQKWLWEKGHGVFDENGKLLGIEGFITDISDRKQLEKSLVETENKYRNIFENAIEGIFQTTLDGHYLNANLALAKIYGYNSPEELQKDLQDIEHQLYFKSNSRKEFIKLLEKNGFVSGFESEVIRKDGKKIWISENARAVRDNNNNILYYEGTVEDITQYKEAKEKLHKQAFYDQLTELPNRTLFLKKLEDVISDYNSKNDFLGEFALFFLDCDKFKVVNDSLGHFIGDELLIAIAKRLLKCVRDDDIVARLGGDEFTILLKNVIDIKQVIKVANRIQNEFVLPFYLQGYKVFSGISIGILFSKNLDKNDLQSLTPASLLNNADTALYKAKANGKGCYEFFYSAMENEALAELELENDLRHALERKELQVYYQPIVSTITRKIKGFEALIRWKHSQKGFIPPAEFIPVAEETELIIPIGNWILEQVCQQINKWQTLLQQKNFDNYANIVVSVNLSYRQFCHNQLLENIDKILKETNINPENLKLEITESYCMIDEKTSIEKMKKIHAKNIHLWLDDFGTGYSSLSYLHQMPISGLKIHSSFVSEIDKNKNKENITKNILTLAKNLNLDVISEGIETENQLKKLNLAGNQFGQGYLFSKPLDVEKATQFLLENIS